MVPTQQIVLQGEEAAVTPLRERALTHVAVYSAPCCTVNPRKFSVAS